MPKVGCDAHWMMSFMLWLAFELTSLIIFTEVSECRTWEDAGDRPTSFNSTLAKHNTNHPTEKQNCAVLPANTSDPADDCRHCTHMDMKAYWDPIIFIIFIVMRTFLAIILFWKECCIFHIWYTVPITSHTSCCFLRLHFVLLGQK